MRATQQLDLLKQRLHLILIVNTIERLLVEFAANTLKIRLQTLILLAQTADFLLQSTIFGRGVRLLACLQVARRLQTSSSAIRRLRRLISASRFDSCKL